MLVKNELGFCLSIFAKFPYLVQNFSLGSQGDMLQEVNLKNYLTLLGLPSKKFVRSHQVHGSKVITANGKAGVLTEEADSLYTNEKGLALVILTADCLPIYVLDREKMSIGLAHAGWRGTKDFVLRSLIEKFTSAGSDIKDLIIGFGPCIGVCHYEIKEDVASEFRKSGLEEALVTREGKVFLDLKVANRVQISTLGIKNEQINGLNNVCTLEDKNLFSYRKNKEKRRNAAVIYLK